MAELDRWVSAFPRSLRSEVAAVVRAIPAARLEPTASEIGSTGKHVVPVFVDGEARPPTALSSQRAASETILACIYTRHHDGRVRERWLERVIDSGEYWTIPFVVALIGEYVLEILTEIHRALTVDGDFAPMYRSSYGKFVAENHAFLELVHQRVISYWNWYYREEHPRSEYVGFALLSLLTETAETR